MGGAGAPFRFLELPGEIRNQVYADLLNIEANKRAVEEGFWEYKHHHEILFVNRQIHSEARAIFRKQNVIVRLETPWPESQDHIRHRGRISFLATGDQAQSFVGHHLEIVIDIPQMQMGTKAVMLLTLEQLPYFCKMWFHSDLDRRGLNALLCLRLRMRNPMFLAGASEEEMLPRSLQKELLLPFGLVKGLSSVTIEGKHYPSVEKELKEAMEVPYDPPEVYLDRCAELKDLGNAQIKANNPRRALELYFDAFAAMHIIISGRNRDIWADHYYDTTLRSGTFKGQSGSIVRMILRIRLVANVLLALLKLADWDEARFWGMRSITQMRGALGEGADDPRPNFPAGHEWGKIFYRTGIACKELGRREEALSLVSISSRWLPDDETVKSQLTIIRENHCLPRESAGGGAETPKDV